MPISASVTEVETLAHWINGRDSTITVNNLKNPNFLKILLHDGFLTRLMYKRYKVQTLQHAIIMFNCNRGSLLTQLQDIVSLLCTNEASPLSEGAFVAANIPWEINEHNLDLENFQTSIINIHTSWKPIVVVVDSSGQFRLTSPKP